MNPNTGNLENLLNTGKKLLKKDFYPYVSLKAYRIGLLVVLSLFVAFGLVDYLIISSREILVYTLTVRLLFVTPIYIISYLLTYKRSFPKYQPVLSFLLGICSMMALITLLYLARQDEQIFFDLYFTAFILALSFAPLVLWYNKTFIIVSLPLVILFFNLVFLFGTNEVQNLNYVLLQNILLISGGILGSYCRYFVINLLRWNVQKTAIISRKKQMLEQAHEKLESSDEMKRLLLSILSHDIKGPMGNVQALLQLLSEGIITPQEFSAQSKHLNCQLTNTKVILDSVLLWSKSEMNIQPGSEAVRLHEVVAENLQGAEIAAIGKNITFHNQVDPAISYFGDHHMVRLILRNLLANAVKFTENGNITVSSIISDGQVTLSVKDDGVGMGKREAEQLFNPGRHFTKDGTRSEKGNGIGLTICQEVIKKCGGKLFVESEPGKGTTFHFVLPVARIEFSSVAGKQRELEVNDLFYW